MPNLRPYHPEHNFLMFKLPEPVNPFWKGAQLLPKAACVGELMHVG